MADQREIIESPKPWEILGSFFAFFAVVKDIPGVLRAFGITKLIPAWLKQKLLGFVGTPDFWLLIFFTAGTLALIICLLWKKKALKEAQEMDAFEDANDKAWEALIRRNRTIHMIKSLGTILLREKALDFFGVHSYGTFQRYADWPLAPDRSKFIDRVLFTNGDGIEFQYATNYENIIVRKHSKEVRQYGDSVTRPPTSDETRLLLLASKYYPFWWIIYSFKRLWIFFRNLPQH